VNGKTRAFELHLCFRYTKISQRYGHTASSLLSSTLPQISPPTPHTSHPFVHLIESIAVPEIPVLKIRHILESVRVDIIPLKSVIPHGVPPLADVADDEDVDDEADVDAEVDVEAV